MDGYDFAEPEDAPKLNYLGKSIRLPQSVQPGRVKRWVIEIAFPLTALVFLALVVWLSGQ